MTSEVPGAQLAKIDNVCEGDLSQRVQNTDSITHGPAELQRLDDLDKALFQLANPSPTHCFDNLEASAVTDRLCFGGSVA